jgi:hypothetical protein
MKTQLHLFVSLIALLALSYLPSVAVAQTTHFAMDSTHFFVADSLHRVAERDLQRFTEVTEVAEPAGHQDNQDSQDSLSNLGTPKSAKSIARQQRLAAFTPDPAKATWSALVFPGGGQIYNHKYWKLPIVYGGFLGCAYALNWNNQMYSDYSQAYLDIMDDDPNTASYEDFLPPRYDIERNKDYLKRVFKNRKDNYRRQRDLSIFCFIGVYLISVVDAYVDAELSNFDITEDLSVQVRPTTINNQQSSLHNQAYGLQCSFNF